MQIFYILLTQTNFSFFFEVIFMRIIGDSPIWTRKNEETVPYPRLTHDLKTDVVIVGGG